MQQKKMPGLLMSAMSNVTFVWLALLSVFWCGGAKLPSTTPFCGPRWSEAPESRITAASQTEEWWLAFKDPEMDSLLLAGVAAISLAVGGIGIMNILLVSVTERTREIGIRMAIGAARIHILWQFLIEAIALSSVGGAIGIVVGLGISLTASAIAGWPISISFPSIIVGFLFSGIIGVFFGYYPALKASRLNVIEALRFE
jgi:ABC-type lipoprotein release transport system permease subunit